MENPSTLSALYYPFSRSISPASTKQMLLVFDSLYFLDPVDDDDWRAELLKDMEAQEDPQFQQYRAIHGALPTLLEEGVVVRVDPTAIATLDSPAISAAAVSDLLDPTWCHFASGPQLYRMPHRSLAVDGSPTWDIFHRSPFCPEISDRLLGTCLTWPE